jgi:xanthine dehydrogenase molybdopterin-binding subunit B
LARALFLITDTQKIADKAANVVKVTYKDCKPPILTIPQAIEAKSFALPIPAFVKDVDVGDVKGL